MSIHFRYNINNYLQKKMSLGRTLYDFLKYNLLLNKISSKRLMSQISKNNALLFKTQIGMLSPSFITIKICLRKWILKKRKKNTIYRINLGNFEVMFISDLHKCYRFFYDLQLFYWSLLILKSSFAGHCNNIIFNHFSPQKTTLRLPY